MQNSSSLEKVDWKPLRLILLVMGLLVGLVAVTTTRAVNHIPVFDPADIHKIGEYTFIPFSLFTSFDYTPDVQSESSEDSTSIPEHITDLDGQKIATEGFMLPLTAPEKGKVRSFLLLIDRLGCCFGKSPPANGSIYVTMQENKVADYARFNSVKVYGTLEVKERIESDGSHSLFRMSADKVEVSGSLKPWWQFW